MTFGLLQLYLTVIPAVLAGVLALCIRSAEPPTSSCKAVAHVQQPFFQAIRRVRGAFIGELRRIFSSSSCSHRSPTSFYSSAVALLLAVSIRFRPWWNRWCVHSVTIMSPSASVSDGSLGRVVSVRWSSDFWPTKPDDWKKFPKPCIQSAQWRTFSSFW